MTRTAQVPWELDQLLCLLDQETPTRTLEIGVWHGGTLRQWLWPHTVTVAIDDQMLDARKWCEWAVAKRATLHLLHGKSQDEQTIAQAYAHSPYDFVFIDGSHTYPDVRADWENYSPMVRAGGLVAFHDILPRAGYGVSTLWREIKEGRRTVEIVGTEPSPDMDDPHAGIGVVFC